MIQNQKVRILWLTDIHFSEGYDGITDERFNTFVKKFIDKAESQHRKVAFDYIIISGDLAQMGLKEDYESFKRLLLDKLLLAIKSTDLPIPKVITIPGNHDVMWKHGDFLESYLNFIDVDKKKSIDRAVYLEDEHEKFRTLFEDYTTFLMNQLTGDFSEFYTLPESDTFKVSGEYDKSRLFGHIIDKKNKMVLILLNTAWYSLGDGFNKVYIKYIKEHYKLNDVTEANLKTWLKTKDVLTEYNKQITGVQLLKKGQIDEYFLNYPDYLVITCCHHSRNWLEWTESYTYNDKMTSSATQFNNITMNSDVVLTGHEHVPKEIDCERILNDVLHLKGGCFLEFDQVDRLENNPSNYANNWFSILNIDTSNKAIAQQKFFYDSDNEDWKMFHKVSEFVTADRVDYILTEFRKQRILNAFAEDTFYGFKAYLEAFFSQKLKDEELNLVLNADQCDLYLLKRGAVTEMCLLLKQPECYAAYLKKDEFIKVLTDQLTTYPKVMAVRIIALDLFVDGQLKKKYGQGNPPGDKKFDRSEIFNHLVKSADTLFDVFRHKFFMKWEDRSRANKNKVDPDFARFIDLKFVNQVIPYWISERYWINKD